MPTELLKILNQCIGKKVIRAENGYGSFAFIGFDHWIEINVGRRILKRPAWDLWIQCCAWRICRFEQPIVGNEDEREVLQSSLNSLVGESLDNVVYEHVSNDIHLTFSGGWGFRTFCSSFKNDSTSWSFAMPAGDFFLRNGLLRFEASSEKNS